MKKNYYTGNNDKVLIEQKYFEFEFDLDHDTYIIFRSNGILLLSRPKGTSLVFRFDSRGLGSIYYLWFSYYWYHFLLNGLMHFHFLFLYFFHRWLLRSKLLIVHFFGGLHLLLDQLLLEPRLVSLLTLLKGLLGLQLFNCLSLRLGYTSTRQDGPLRWQGSLRLPNHRHTFQDALHIAHKCR